MIPPALLDPRIRWDNIHKPMEVRAGSPVFFRGPPPFPWNLKRSLADVDRDPRIPYAGKDKDER